MKLAIVIPAYNEEKNITKVIKGIPKNLANKIDIIVVNDGSTDKTKELAEKTNAIVINHEKNKGYGSALISGFERALKNKADVITIIDGDAQHYPNEITKVIEPIKNKEADFVIGSRFLTYTKIPFYRRQGIKLINSLINLLSGLKITDSQSGFRAFTSDVIKNINVQDKKMGFSIEVLFQIAKNKYRIKEVPIRCDYSPESHKTNPIIQGLQLLNAIIKNYLKYKLFSNNPSSNKT